MIAITGLLAALVLAVAIVACGGGSAGGGEPAARAGDFRGSGLDPVEAAPPLRLKDVSGRTVDLEDLRGKAVLVAFIFARCPDICPLTVDKIRAAQRQLGAGARDLRVVGVSVDPEGDTPATVRNFIRGHRMTGRMDYLMGTRPELEAVWRRWGVAVQPTPDSPALIAHSGTVFGVDAAGRVAVMYPQTFTPADVAHDVPILAGART
ncbi:MAG: SCO family protein [Thermoleophilia bacterium]|nr:SCO family protein [Thermoleophilia bacterium]